MAARSLLALVANPSRRAHGARRRAVACAVALIVGGALTACGGGGDASIAPGSTSAPGAAPAPSPAPSTDPGASTGPTSSPTPTPTPTPTPNPADGTLTLSGDAAATSFTPSGSMASLPIANGPTCSTTNGDTVCTSTLALNWTQAVIDPLGAEQPVGIVTVALTSTVHGSPGDAPGVGVNAIQVSYDAGAKPYYQLYCDDLGVVACTTADSGITWDLAARTVSFDHTRLTEDSPGTGHVVLDGTLRY